MIKYLLILSCLCLFIDIACEKEENLGDSPDEQNEIKTHGIIPLPKQFVFLEGILVIDKEFSLVKNEQFKIASDEAEDLLLNSVNSLKSQTTNLEAGKSLQIIADNSIKEDAYELTVNANGIQIKAGNESGAFAAIQSLKQYVWNLTSGVKQDSFELNFINIYDEPKYEWRGFQLDVARHMFTKEYLKQIIDWLAYYKFNRFQIHFTDDQGWRIESKKFPLLHEVGAWRVLDGNTIDTLCYDLAVNDSDFELDDRFIKMQHGEQVYGGYYTQEELREIVGYANAHFIDIIPEIDMPGHMSAAIEAYPFLTGTGTGWGKEFSHPICPCNDSVYNFVYELWDEIIEIFPSEYVHIGADEVENASWAESEDCIEFIRENNLSGIDEIMTVFVRRLQEHLEGKGRTVLTWDDVIDYGNIDKNLKITYWRDWKANVASLLANNGNQIIFSRWDMFYFWYWFTGAKLQNILEYDITREYPSSVTNKIIGFQACHWTEYTASEAIFERSNLPYILAFSEINWSGNRDWYSFKMRLKPNLNYLNGQYVKLGNIEGIDW